MTKFVMSNSLGWLVIAPGIDGDAMLFRPWLTHVTMSPAAAVFPGTASCRRRCGSHRKSRVPLVRSSPKACCVVPRRLRMVSAGQTHDQPCGQILDGRYKVAPEVLVQLESSVTSCRSVCFRGNAFRCRFGVCAAPCVRVPAMYRSRLHRSARGCLFPGSRYARCQAVARYQLAAAVKMRLRSINQRSDRCLGEGAVQLFGNLPNGAPALEPLARPAGFFVWVHGCSFLFNERLEYPGFPRPRCGANSTSGRMHRAHIRGGRKIGPENCAPAVA